MADARGLGPRGETLAGSSPVSPTIFWPSLRQGEIFCPSHSPEKTAEIKFHCERFA